MSKHIQFQGPFVKRFYSKDASNARTAGNPALPSGYDEPVPSPVRRVHLFIQNQSVNEVEIGFSPNGLTGGESVLKLYPGQSVSFDNYNGPVFLSDISDVHIMEAFA